MEILRAEHLTKIYGKGNTSVTAVNDLSLSVAQGEFVAVVGSSGSGKSTLLHMLGGVDQPTEGKVWIQGEDIYTLSTEKLAIFRRRQIGLIYQFFNLIPTLNVEENITLPCELDGQTVDKKRLDKLIDELGLNGRKTHLPEELSGGQQQRVSIGRALINRPAIVLADEPTGNLDKKNSDEIVELLRRANQEYRQTIIMITHNLEIAKTADRVIVIEDGKNHKGGIGMVTSIMKKRTIRERKKNRRQTIAVWITTCIATALFAAIFSFASSCQAGLIEYAKDLSGDYDYVFYDVPREEADHIVNNRKVATAYQSVGLGYAKLSGSKNPDKPYVYLTAMDNQVCRKMPCI